MNYKKTALNLVGHSPGPWKITDQGMYFWIEDFRGRLLGSVEWKKSQNEFPFTVGKNEAYANANLISAVPDLLWYAAGVSFKNYPFLSNTQ